MSIIISSYIEYKNRFYRTLNLKYFCHLQDLPIGNIFTSFLSIKNTLSSNSVMSNDFMDSAVDDLISIDDLNITVKCTITLPDLKKISLVG